VSSSAPIGAGRYIAAELADLADDYQVALSLSRAGQCWDNALAESVLSSLGTRARRYPGLPARTAVGLSWTTPACVTAPACRARSVTAARPNSRRQRKRGPGAQVA
jgi:hypothetical protein